jgi:thymidylate synthase (FAD)
MKADDIKQGSGGPVPPQEQARLEAEWVSRNLMSLEAYEEDLAEGVAPELARTNLPQSLMTSWTWSGTLGAFANMCKLRLSKDTQYETRLVAQGVYAELKKQFPISAPLLVEGVL